VKVVGNVTPEEVPVEARTARSKLRGSIWQDLVEQVIESHENGQVTVVVFADEAEYKKMRNSTAALFRERAYTLYARMLKDPDGLRVFMELRVREPRANGRVRRQRYPKPTRD